MPGLSPTQIRLSALWASTLFCYIYCDYFELYVPGKLESMIAGQIGPFSPITQPLMLAMGSLLLVPSLMIAASVLLPRGCLRPLSLLVGAFYTLLMALLANAAGWWFYTVYALVEAVLTATVVWLAWRWPHGSENGDLAKGNK